MKTRYDTIVLGVGGMGSATVYALARMGCDVLGVDLHPPGHDRGSAHGETRAIRQAYFEHPNYVPLATASFELWRDLEQRTGKALLQQTGLLQAGPENGEVVQGVLAAAAAHELAIDRLSADEASRRYAPLTFQSDHVVLWEHMAGYLHVEKCVKAHYTAAESLGATFAFGHQITGCVCSEHSVRVSTDQQTFESDQVVVCMGAGTPAMLPLGLPICVVQKHQFWFGVEQHRQALQELPIYLVESENEVFYGFPLISERGIKMARHSGGVTVDGNPITGDAREDAAELAADQQRVTGFFRRLLPSIPCQVADQSTCWYSTSVDGHFYLGRMPDAPRVFVAGGMSGHGFKFAPVIGKALAQLLTAGNTEYPIGFLSPSRIV